MDFTGTTCVVTGGSEGIGYATALALGRRGTSIALCARTRSKVEQAVRTLRADGVTAVGRPCDVADAAQVRDFAAFVRAEIGPADILVNNAGIGHFVDVDAMTLAQFDETLATNLRGVFLMTQAFLPEMKQRGRGDIVNIASLAGKNPVAGAAVYAASKHAVLGFSKSLMLEVRRHGIRVIAICPGTVVTGFFEKHHGSLEHADRKLRPEDVAHAVVAALDASDRAMISEVDIRPTNP